MAPRRTHPPETSHPHISDSAQHGKARCKQGRLGYGGQVSYCGRGEVPGRCHSQEGATKDNCFNGMPDERVPVIMTRMWPSLLPIDIIYRPVIHVLS
jgi:hypothetical protein